MIPSGTRITKHVHADMNEVFYVISGTGRAGITRDGEVETVMELSQGCCLVVEAGEQHWLESTGSLQLIYWGILSS
jgi:mannose-6-phosphate isomerase-like protein (cupin superfamily)